MKEDELAELAALADGALPEKRRRELEARVAASPRLQALLAEQRSTRDAVRAQEVGAPRALREAVEARLHRPDRRAGLGYAAAAAVAAVATIVVVVARQPESPPPVIERAVALGAGPRLVPQPVSQPRRRTLTGAAVEGLRFPDWSGEYGWRARGSRVDRLGDRRATTVFYVRGGQRIAYTILTGGPIALPPSAARHRWRGRLRHVLELRGRTAVVWERRGHICVLSATGLERGKLLELTGTS